MRRLSHSVRVRAQGARPGKVKAAGREEMIRIDDERGERGAFVVNSFFNDMMRSNARGPVDLHALLSFWIMMMRRDERSRRRDLRSSLFVFHRKADLVHRERRDRALRVSVHQVRTGRRPVAVPVQSNYPLSAHTIPYA